MRRKHCRDREQKKQLLKQAQELHKQLFNQEQIINNQADIKNKDFLLLCGIAQPERVAKTAKKFNAKILKSYFFPDLKIYIHLTLF